MYVTSLIFYELDQQVKNPLRIHNVFKNKKKFKKTIFPAFKKLLNKQYFLNFLMTEIIFFILITARILLILKNVDKQK